MTQQRITHSLIRTLTQLITFALLFMQPAHAGNYIAFIHTDVLGNPVAVTDQNGNIVSREHVTPFGDSLGKRSSDDTTPIGSSDHGIGYTGHIRDKDLGLTYMQARYYDPTIGRFMGTDPVGFTDNLDPAYFNRFSYVKNNPYIHTDPFGESDLDMLDSNRNTIGMDMACPVCSPAGSGPGPLDYGAFAADDILGGSGHSIEAGGELLSGLAILGTSGILDQRKSRKSVKRNRDATKSGTTVIGRVKNLQNLKKGEQSLLDRLPNQGSPKANWKQNSGVLRQEMGKGKPIRDASPGDNSGQFLNAERNLLRDRGWTFDSKTNYWNPPN